MEDRQLRQHPAGPAGVETRAALEAQPPQPPAQRMAGRQLQSRLVATAGLA